MALLGLKPGPVVGRAYKFLLEERMEHGPLEPDQAEARAAAVVGGAARVRRRTNAVGRVPTERSPMSSEPHLPSPGGPAQTLAAAARGNRMVQERAVHRADRPAPDGRGRATGQVARPALDGVDFDLVLTSPLQRARRTAELAGFPDAVVEPAAHEWDYGDYEGDQQRRRPAKNPGYLIWTDGVPNGETLDQVAARADSIIARVRGPAAGRQHVANALLVAHGHFLRILTARWLELAPVEGRHFVLGTAKVCTLGWDKRTPAIEQWGL